MDEINIAAVRDLQELLHCDSTSSMITDGVLAQLARIYGSGPIYDQEKAAYDWMCRDLRPEDLAKALEYLTKSYSFQKAKDVFEGIQEAQWGSIVGLTDPELERAIAIMQTGRFDLDEAVALVSANTDFDEILAELDPVQTRISHCETRNIEEDPRAIVEFLKYMEADPAIAATTYLCNFDSLTKTNTALGWRQQSNKS